MHLTPFATFEADFPDGSLEKEGNAVVPQGENIARAISESLAARGYQVSTPGQHSHYGWSIDLRGDAGYFWLLVQYPDPWLLIVHDSRMIWTRVFRGQAAFAALIDDCRACLASISGI